MEAVARTCDQVYGSDACGARRERRHHLGDTLFVGGGDIETVEAMVGKEALQLGAHVGHLCPFEKGVVGDHPVRLAELGKKCRALRMCDGVTQ